VLTRDHVEAIIHDVLKLPDDYPLTEDLRPAFVPGWDSIAWLGIVAEAEDALGHEIAPEALGDVVTVGDLYSVLTTI
jgi:acyl carrier protein